MAAVAPRQLLKSKLQDACVAVEAYRDAELKRRSADMEKWVRISPQRASRAKRIGERIAALDDALAAMQTALSKV